MPLTENDVVDAVVVKIPLKVFPATVPEIDTAPLLQAIVPGGALLVTLVEVTALPDCCSTARHELNAIDVLVE